MNILCNMYIASLRWHEIRKRKANWIGHILHRNCLLKQDIEGKIKGEMEGTRRRGRRRKKLLDDLQDRRRYSHLKEEALDRTTCMWRNQFGGGFGPVVRQNTEWMIEKELGQCCFLFSVRLMHQTSPCLPLAPTPTHNKQARTHTYTHTALLFNIFASAPRNPKLWNIFPLPYVNKRKEFVARQSGCGVIATSIPVNRMATGLRLQDNARNCPGGGKKTVLSRFGGDRSRVLLSWS